MAKAKALRSGRFRTANIWEFAHTDLPALQRDLHAVGMPTPSADDIASGLIWTAHRMPPAVVKAMIETYLQAESRDFLDREEAAETTNGNPE